MAAGEMSVEHLKSRRKAVEDDAALSDSQKAELLELYDNALKDTEIAGEYQDREFFFRSSIDLAPPNVEAVRARIEEIDASEDVPIEESLGDATLKDLEKSLLEARAELASLDAQQKTLDRQLEDANRRPEQARGRITEARGQLNELKALLPATVETDAASPRAAALMAARRGKVEHVSAEIAMLEQELVSLGARLQLLEARRDLGQRLVRRLRQRVSGLENLVVRAREREALEVTIEAERAEREAAGKHPQIENLARENAQLGGELSRRVSELTAATAEREKVDTELRALERSFKRVEQRFEIAGLSSSLEKVLRTQRARLPDTTGYRKRIEDVQDALADAAFEQFDIEDRLLRLSEARHAVEARMASIDETALSEVERQAVSEEIHQLLQSQRDLLGRLGATNGKYGQMLGEIEYGLRRAIETSDRFGDFMDEHLLWIPSASPVNRKTADLLRRAVQWLLSPAQWGDAFSELFRQVLTHPLLTLVAAFLITVLFRSRAFMRRSLLRLNERVGMLYADHFRSTARALLVTALAAAPWPLLFWFTGGLLHGAEDPSGFAPATGRALQTISTTAFTLIGFKLLCFPYGVARVHFRWEQQTVRTWRRELAWFVPPALSLLFLTALIESAGRPVFNESLGRAAFVALVIVSLVFFHRVLNPATGVLREFYEKNPDNFFITRLRYVWYWAVFGLALCFCGLALYGYYYTALNLQWELLATVRIVLGAVILYHLGIRLLVLAQRKIVLLDTLGRRKAEKAMLAGQEVMDGKANAALADMLELPGPTPESIDQQTRKVLNTAIGIFVIVTLWLTWSNVVPALGILDTMVVWEATDVVGGEATRTAITAGSIVFALLIALLTVVAARNLPGTLEIAVLRRFSLDPGTRYATTTILQYLIAAIGIVYVFNKLGWRWSEIQWLVAALGVGLGFGMQEIFGNFMSGLIILFEQPVRVGDTVTVGNVTGTVTRIRIRATTLLDWDRKELVIPNKMFITDQLTNWSLSDPVTRVIVPVGIAYGSDTELAHRVMLETATKNPMVLEEPEPAVLFLGFGDSSLNFEVRVFAKDLGDRMPLIHALHMAIDAALRRHGIEIPFPQRDIHVRTLPGATPGGSGEEEPGP
jgi:potassium efflux system protein